MTAKAARARLLKYALAKPEATLEHPWGENVTKVRGKVFVFFGVEPPEAQYKDYVMGVKLTTALLYAKSLPYVEPMGYGLGKSGWVSVKAPKGAIPYETFEEWIDESYATVAPKRPLSPSGAAPRGGGGSKGSSRTSTRRARRSSPGRARPTRS